MGSSTALTRRLQQAAVRQRHVRLVVRAADEVSCHCFGCVLVWCTFSMILQISVERTHVQASANVQALATRALLFLLMQHSLCEFKF